MSHVWWDGTFVHESKALLPATDPAFLYGHGVFEVVRTYGGAPFRLPDHVERMKASARHFRIPFRPPRLDGIIRELCRRNDAPDAYVRLTLSARGHLLVLARRRTPLPQTWYERGAKVLFSTWRRDPRAPLAGHKTLNYLENVLCHDDAVRRGYADLIYLGPNDEVLEGSVTSLFLVKKGRVFTPPLSRGILPGVTRKIVAELRPVTERKLYRSDVKGADEAFLTNAMIEILPVGRPGPVTRPIAEAYRAETDRLR